MAYGQMSDPQFRQGQLDGLRLPHIAPVNALVDELTDPAGRGWVPYLAPAYGGVDARVLCVLRDPGPKTNDELGGSGFLSADNDDPTAKRFAALLDAAGIPVSEILAWNAYPWYVNHKPTPAELEAGVEPLRGCSASFPGSGWSCSTEGQPRTAGRGWRADIPAWRPGSRPFPPTTPATRPSSGRPKFAHTAWRIWPAHSPGPPGRSMTPRQPTAGNSQA
jgi:hypothetical protein